MLWRWLWHRAQRHWRQQRQDFVCSKRQTRCGKFLDRLRKRENKQPAKHNEVDSNQNKDVEDDVAIETPEVGGDQNKDVQSGQQV